jgi:hypothetical protein
MDDALNSTQLQELSAAIAIAMDSIQNSPVLSAINALSGIPLHPYERLKYDLFGADYKDIKFKTIDDIEVPESVELIEYLPQVTKTSDTIHKKLLHNATCEPEHITSTAFFTLSNDTIPIPDLDKHREHIEFVEMIKQIPVNDINSKTAVLYAKKIASEYLRIHG